MTGERVRLIRCTDPHTSLRPGDTGTVVSVDPLGTVHVRWDNGSTLGLVPGEDEWEPTDYPDPWGPGGKFIETGLHKIADDPEA